MNVLIVGNVFKDVYLNIDGRSENFETDRDGTKWLDLSFDSSEHRFFSRVSNYGGAAITLEVLNNFGIDASISDSAITFDEDGIQIPEDMTPDLYRYILVSDEKTAYFAPSYEHETHFIEPQGAVDCIFIDRSANFNDYELLLDYLKRYPETKLVIHLRNNPRNKYEKELISMATLIFTEHPIDDSAISKNAIVYIKGKKFTLGDLSSEIVTPREGLMTHLSIYSILAATILAGALIGKTNEESFRMAKINVEKSSLDATLGLDLLEELSC